MNKLMLSLVAGLAVATAFADEAVKISYLDSNKHHGEALRRESVDVVEWGWSPLALAFVPRLELPSEEYAVSPLRISVFVGRHMDVSGLDIAGLGSFVTREFNGLQVSTLFNCIGEADWAVQVAGILNRCEGEMNGLQVGVVNIAEKGSGLQVGVVNYGNVYKGLQIGVANVIEASNCRFMPVINFAF